MDTELPASPLLLRLFAEHPWTVVWPLLLAGALLAWLGARNERPKQILLGVAALVVAAGVLTLASLWDSPGEQAAEAVRHLVQCAEQGDVGGVQDCFLDSATLHYGTPEAPGVDIRDIRAAAQSLGGRNRVSDNTITELQSATVDSTTAQVLLGCRTSTASSYGAVPTRWWIELVRQPGGPWRIQRLAFLSVAGQRPGPGTI